MGELDTNRAALEYISLKPTVTSKSPHAWFIAGVTSETAKEYHTKKMYSEEEVKELCLRAMQFGGISRNYPYKCRIDWFELNKKK